MTHGQRKFDHESKKESEKRKSFYRPQKDIYEIIDEYTARKYLMKAIKVYTKRTKGGKK